MSVQQPVGFVFETCCSGGFIDDLTNTPDRVIATACGHDQLSFGSEGEIDEEAFAAFDGAICSCNSWVLPFNCAMRGNVPDSVVNDGSYPWRDSEDEVDRAYCLVADANGDGRISFRSVVHRQDEKLVETSRDATYVHLHLQPTPSSPESDLTVFVPTPHRLVGGFSGCLRTGFLV